jgi:hypothetical protein
VTLNSNEKNLLKHTWRAPENNTLHYSRSKSAVIACETISWFTCVTHMSNEKNLSKHIWRTSENICYICCLRIVVSNTYCAVFLFCLSSSLRCQFLWIGHFWLPLRYSLTFISEIEVNVARCKAWLINFKQYFGLIKIISYK